MQLANSDIEDDDTPAFGQIAKRRAPRVLLAEDDDDLRTLIGESLRVDGYQVVEARDGGELLDMIADWLVYKWPEDPVDLILSDVRMPGYSGMDVLAGLRKAHWDTPVVLITAHGNAALRTEATRLGASAVLSKPFDLDDLRTAVLHVISRNRPVLSPRLLLRRQEVFDTVDREFAFRSESMSMSTSTSTRRFDRNKEFRVSEHSEGTGSCPRSPPEREPKDPTKR